MMQMACEYQHPPQLLAPIMIYSVVKLTRDNFMKQSGVKKKCRICKSGTIFI